MLIYPKVNFLKSLELDPKLEESRYFLNILENKYESITYIPNILIQEYHDNIKYDNSKLLHDNVDNAIEYILPHINIKFICYQPIA